LEEQRRIAEVLGEWDKAIELQAKLVERLQTRKHALMQQLLTPLRRLSNFTQPWQKVKLLNITDRVIRKNIENDPNVMTISAQKGFISQTVFFNKVIASEKLDNYFLVHKNEFCYNKSYCNGYPMGAIKRLNNAEKAVVTSLYICFKVKENEADISFLEHYFEAGLLNKHIMKIANEGGRAHGLLNVTPSDFFAMSFNVPPIDEQKAIAEVLSKSDKEIAIAERKLTALRTQKRALMQQLLTGKKQLKYEL
jgi:type I restriction enzyme, S subunit